MNFLRRLLFPVLPVIAAMLAAPVGRADTGVVKTLHQFSGTALYAGLIQGADGNYYGTTGGGGAYGYGSVFKITPAGVLTTLHNFTYADGEEPQAALVEGTDGNFYGTTYLGGTNDAGTAFKVSPSGAFTLLHQFAEATGYHSQSAMIQAADGNFYGTTTEGGTVQDDFETHGAVYRLTPAGAYSVVHSFEYAEADYPEGSLVQGKDGNLYGTASFGGDNGAGTIFKMTLGGVVTVLHSFTLSKDGGEPVAGMVQGNDGNFYGVTNEGGTEDLGRGTFFRVTSGGGFTMVHSFKDAEGSAPAAPLIKGKDGSFYGTASGGGEHDAGAVFHITTGGGVTVLHSFDPYPATYEPNASLCLGSDGNLYGTTFMGGVIYHGEIFRLSTAGAGFTDFYKFPKSNGATPFSGLVHGTDGNFYGTTYYGGDYGVGTVYKVTSNGVPTTLHSFNTTDGREPVGALIQGSDGFFYGTTLEGGSEDTGTFFRISSTGAFTSLHSFNNAEGYMPNAGVIEGVDKNFYGTTSSAGPNDFGTAYKMTPAGGLTILHAFANSDGSNAQAPLILGSDGNLYGTTTYGLPNDVGTVFKIATDGTGFKTLHTFTDTDGKYPHSGLIVGSDHNLYGTTTSGGAHGYGTVFRITSGGAYLVLHNFDFDDGYSPEGELLQASDGNLYGTTSEGGDGDSGTIFRLTIAGKSFALLHSFVAFDGTAPFGTLVQGTDGNFYGTNSASGTTDGTIFRFSLQPVLTSARTATGTVGKAFSYQTTATNNPTKFAAAGLPPGLSINAATGSISGQPTKAGTYVVTLSLTNGFGTSIATLNIAVKPGAPVITSTGTASGKVGTAFAYQIAANNNPTSYGVSGLKDGLKVDPTTGKMSGTPTAAGTFSLTLKAANAAGTGSKTLTVTITN